MFTGLSAFPLTPVSDDKVDEKSFQRIMKRLVDARVDSVGVLGSTGSYAYLSQEQRATVARRAVENADGIPVMVGIGAISTTQMLRLADDAQQAGADALLLPPMSYQKLSDDEVYGLYETLTQQTSVPICVYDNPGTTHFTFSDELHARIAVLPGIASIKIPGVPADIISAMARVDQLRQKLPTGVSIGISGDAFAGLGLNAGCDCWYSVCGGLFPREAKAITEAAAQGETERVTELVGRLAPLWALFLKHGGSLRVMAAAAAAMGLTDEDNLPLPLQGLSQNGREEVVHVISELGLK
ncbi:dihydrodipicolinate synthase family protein [Serratia inhibens]|uniref:dihydrodipicolinate synthase family protein n=1 Tax=Serratia inhibens TaxID=2338073 RepID=UPI00025E36C1|nr:dihydrodipicolinate synthase family protein [Serratia inhibens]ANS43026.1 4-hydroxy-tetrahydrodipicolinate synthase [Serratia inhibens PRI-2C]